MKAYISEKTAALNEIAKTTRLEYEKFIKEHSKDGIVKKINIIDDGSFTLEFDNDEELEKFYDIVREVRETQDAWLQSYRVDNYESMAAASRRQIIMDAYIMKYPIETMNDESLKNFTENEYKD